MVSKIVPIYEEREKECDVHESEEISYIHITCFPPEEGGREVYMDHQGDSDLLEFLLHNALSIFKKKKEESENKKR